MITTDTRAHAEILARMIDDPTLRLSAHEREALRAAITLLDRSAPASTDTRAALEKATVRLEILRARMMGCPSHEADSTHDLSILEIDGWVEEQREILVALARSAPEERGEGAYG